MPIIILCGITLKGLRYILQLILLKVQCWTVGKFFTFGRSRMFGPQKLRPLAVGRSRSRRIKNCKKCVIKFFVQH